MAAIMSLALVGARWSERAGRTRLATPLAPRLIRARPHPWHPRPRHSDDLPMEEGVVLEGGRDAGIHREEGEPARLARSHG
jgi:hypothetical protein